MRTSDSHLHGGVSKWTVRNPANPENGKLALPLQKTTWFSTCTSRSIRKGYQEDQDCEWANIMVMSAFTAFILWGGACFAEHDIIQSNLSFLSCAAETLFPLPSLDTNSTNRKEKVGMKSQAREISLFRSRGSAARFWMFQRSDLAAQRRPASLCTGLQFRGQADGSARFGGRPGRLARRSSGTGGKERPKRAFW